MPSSTRIFITGGTGFLGSCVLDRLISHPNASNHEITALVRSPDGAEKLESLGIKTILGSYDDPDLGFLKRAARENDVVISVASTPARLVATKALLQGFKQRFEETGTRGVYIHTSGAALLCDMTSSGQSAPHKVYSDLDVEALNSVPESAQHRDIDRTLIEADNEGYVQSYIITPGFIFGKPSGAVFDLGITNRFTIDVPFMIMPSIKRKQGGVIGTGKGVWVAVDVHDAADLFILLLDAVLDDSKVKAIGHGREGYYFAASFGYEHRAVANAIAGALVDLGFTQNREATSFSEEELGTLFGDAWRFVASNCSIRSDRSRALGWKPVKTLEDLLEVEKKMTEEVLGLYQKGELKGY